ncbi:VanZ like family protein [Pontibacter akesuensis]|uniref:VanZ like family protein n=2 Tax=Pontibacter akesuensis TaxID=388950 RepID=A0A1I7KA90_9BACT|nr:VanZ like family protein [Pontibacter akesuensis]
MLVLTLLPSSSLPSVSGWNFFSIASMAHVFLFCVLTFLMIVGLSKQHSHPYLNRNAIRSSLLISTAFGIFIELLQHFLNIGREGDIFDVLSNTIGCLIGILVFKWIYTW